MGDERVATLRLPEVAFDESGNTGADLLNLEQPVFALASVALSPAAAEELLSPLHADSAREIKFSELRRSRSGRQRLLEFLGSSALDPDHVVVSVFHKRFMAVAKIVDLLVEPLAHEDGVDLFRNACNLSYSNLLYIAMPVLFGREDVDNLLKAFVNMFRVRSREAVAAFYSIAEGIFGRNSDTAIAGHFAPVVASQRIINDVLAHNDKLALDPAIPAFFQQCGLWGERFGCPFRLVHDESKPILQDKEALESLMAPEEEPVRIGYGSRKLLFPIRAEGIEFAASQDDSRLQVADLVAGAAAAWTTSRVDMTRRSPFTEGLAATRLDRLLIGGVWPTDALSPAELDAESDDEGINAIEHMMRFLSKRRN